MPPTRRALHAALLAVTLAATGPTAIAQTDASREPLWEIGAVALGVSQQAWPGASEEVRRAIAVPYLLYRGPWLRIDRSALGVRALRRDGFELDIGVAGSFGSGGNDTVARAGMPRLGTLVEFGPRGRWDLGPAPGGGQWRFDLPLRGVLDLDDRLRSRGFVVEPEMQYRHESLGGWRLTASAGVLLGDQRLNATLYEVAPAHANATRATYQAQAGLVAWRLGVFASHRLSPDWRVFGFGRLDHVGGAANSNSPLVSRQTGFTGGLGLQWTWMRSAQPAVD